MKKIILEIVLGLVISQNIFAALPNLTEKNLQLDQNFEKQLEIAQDTRRPMNIRWKALMTAAENADDDQLQKLMIFSKDKEWFMRNALLVALSKSESELANSAALDLINDKALVVRSAAVDVLSQTREPSTRRLFSEEMMKSYNFNGSSSLWIRPQMMKYLVLNANEEDRDYFVRFLYDKDAQVAEMSTEALEKITKIRYTGKDRKDVLAQWKKHAQTSKW